MSSNNNDHNGSHQENSSKSTISATIDPSPLGPLRSNRHSTDINSTISGKERPIKLNNPLFIHGYTYNK